MIFRYLTVKFPNASAASCRCITTFYSCLFSLTRIIKIKLMTDIMRWLAKAALKGAYGSKATTIEKVIRNEFSFQQIPSQKKKKNTTVPLRVKKKKKITYLEHQLLCNHRLKSFRHWAEIYSSTTYIFYNTYKSIRSWQLRFVTHLE